MLDAGSKTTDLKETITMPRNHPRCLSRWTHTLMAICLLTSLPTSPAAAAIGILSPPTYVEDGICIEIESNQAGAVRVSVIDKPEFGFVQVGWDGEGNAILSMNIMRVGNPAKATYIGKDSRGYHTWSIWINTHNDLDLDFRVEIFENNNVTRTFDDINSTVGVCRVINPILSN